METHSSNKDCRMRCPRAGDMPVKRGTRAGKQVPRSLCPVLCTAGKSWPHGSAGEQVACIAGRERVKIRWEAGSLGQPYRAASVVEAVLVLTSKLLPPGG